MVSMHRGLDAAVSQLTDEMTKAPANDQPIGYIRYAVIQSVSTSTAVIRYAGSTTNITLRFLSGASLSNGNTVIVIKYGGDAFILGKLA